MINVTLLTTVVINDTLIIFVKTLSKTKIQI